MDQDLIKRRAYIVFELTKEILMEGVENDSYAEAYRFSYLILRGPRKFLETFKNGELLLNFDLISAGYFMLRFDLAGERGLNSEEGKIILNHNEEVQRLLSPVRR